MARPLDPTLDGQLAELLGLHLLERELMSAQRHAEHQLCVDRKLGIAHAIEALAAQSSALSPSQSAQVCAIKIAALANAQIAEKMLLLCKAKMDLIRRLCSPSYGSDGRVSPPGGSGGLLDLRA